MVVEKNVFSLTSCFLICSLQLFFKVNAKIVCPFVLLRFSHFLDMFRIKCTGEEAMVSWTSSKEHFEYTEVKHILQL